MKPIHPGRLAGTVLAAVWGICSAGCSSLAVKTAYGLELADVDRSASNGGEKYAVIQIREPEKGPEWEPQASVLAAQAQSRLVKEFPQWFSSGPDAVPVIVLSRASVQHLDCSAGSLFPSIVTSIGALCTLGFLPCCSPVHRMDFETRLLQVAGEETSPVVYSARTRHVGAPKPLLDAAWPECAGWKRLAGEKYPAGFDENDSARVDALGASIARLVQQLGPEGREALRNNNEAWYWDAKLGHKRNRRVEISRTAPMREEGEKDVFPTVPVTHPTIIGQRWDSSTRSGMIRADVSRCEDRNAAMAWIRDEYLPEYCRLLGVAVQADSPASTPEARVAIRQWRVSSDGVVEIEFGLLE